MDDKYDFLSSARFILELGAAPGGWTQVIRTRAAQAKIIACDLEKCDAISGVTFVQQDFLKLTAEQIIDLLQQNQDTNLGTTREISRQTTEDTIKDERPMFDVILSDMSPKLSGNSLKDQAGIFDLALEILDRAEELLEAENGILLFKFFQGSEMDNLRQEIKMRDYKMRIIKPDASKDKSREIYIFLQKNAK